MVPVKRQHTTSDKPKQQWVPPYPAAGKRKETKFVDDTPVLKKEPKLIEEAPTYTVPPLSNDISTAERNERITNLKGFSARKDFIRVFSKLTGKYRAYDIWADFVTMAACAISNSVDKSHFDERENEYLRIVKKYSKEEQELFSELFAHVVLALEENPEQEFLGDVYTQMGLNSKAHQQIFTPYHIAQMMSEITMEKVEEEIEDKGFVTAHDSCCGGGVTLIAAANVAKERLQKKGLNFQNHILVTGQDIDPIVTMMSYIQLSLLGVAGYFKVGNSITEPMSAADSLDNYWFTPMYFSTVWHYRRMFKKLDWLFKSENEE